MAAITERFQGLRRPGASLLKKTLPSRPDEPVLARKAVPPPKVVVEQPVAVISPTASSTASTTPVQPQAQLKGLPPTPSPSYPVPTSSLPPTPSASSVSSPASVATTIPAPSPQFQPQSQPQFQSQSQFQQSQPQSPPAQPQTQQTRPPRTTSLNSPQNNPYQDRRPPQHRQITNLQPNQPRPNLSPNGSSAQSKRPISEAPSISQFIPDPEPEPELPDSEQEPDLILDNQSSNSSGKTPSTNSSDTSIISPGLKQFPDGYIPPIPEPMVIPPLTNVHFGCFHSHASMPATSNVWYATACMTCKKVDQEVRHRCTFCCMRICAACFEGLRKCKNRDLRELMGNLS
ncbi:uncharacterized protein BHQ10_008735 [Talaromyces amestolkiae]|uniref:Uncharacterized protein n=1 Tax=Talaromyces amestolkiae TaxID=1196081 RepID=A0A364LAC4_TALAM|nr:uncharacterized protein BHQ10_008735 [Talaromyces amestolkiae]RAO72723.1 hypothetical protein BHQ10_008735 [Talaromyces amestolkiae]